jgi:hypothetical protein
MWYAEAAWQWIALAALALFMFCPGPPGRLSALSVSRSEGIFYGVLHGRAGRLSARTRGSPAGGGRAVNQAGLGPLGAVVAAEVVDTSVRGAFVPQPRTPAPSHSDGIVPPEDHIKLICTAALWVNPLVAPRSFFVCARKLAQKHTSIPRAAKRSERYGLDHKMELG